MGRCIKLFHYLPRLSTHRHALRFSLNIELQRRHSAPDSTNPPRGAVPLPLQGVEQDQTLLSLSLSLSLRPRLTSPLGPVRSESVFFRCPCPSSRSPDCRIDFECLKWRPFPPRLPAPRTLSSCKPPSSSSSPSSIMNLDACFSSYSSSPICNPCRQLSPNGEGLTQTGGAGGGEWWARPIFSTRPPPPSRV